MDILSRRQRRSVLSSCHVLPEILAYDLCHQVPLCIVLWSTPHTPPWFSICAPTSGNSQDVPKHGRQTCAYRSAREHDREPDASFGQWRRPRIQAKQSEITRHHALMSVWVSVLAQISGTHEPVLVVQGGLRDQIAHREILRISQGIRYRIIPGELYLQTLEVGR